MYPVTFKIKDYKGDDIKGSFYRRELQFVDKSDNIWPMNQVLNTRKRRGHTEYLVNFIGYLDTLTQWIPQGQLFDNANKIYHKQKRNYIRTNWCWQNILYT